MALPSIHLQLLTIYVITLKNLNFQSDVTPVIQTRDMRTVVRPFAKASVESGIIMGISSAGEQL